MLKTTGLVTLTCGALVAAPLAASSNASMGFRLNATVPTTCSVSMLSTQTGSANGNAVNLGTVREYCNAARGYQVIVSYTPGTLDGAELTAGNDRIVLDGSGRAVLSQTTRPRVRERGLTIVPGAAGFDTSQFQLDIVPS